MDEFEVRARRYGGGWREFFGSYPDYRNVFTRVQVEGDFVAIAMYSTCSHGPLYGPAPKSTRVRDGLARAPENRRKIGLD